MENRLNFQNQVQRRKSPSMTLCVATSLYLCVAGQCAAGQSAKCSQKTLDELETKSDQIRDWSTLQAFYHRYRPCRVEDAEIEQGVSESVARMLADHWESLPAAQKLFTRDPAFESFALLGINITDSTDDLNKIDKLAAEHCPVGLNALCQKIRKSIRTNN